ncbi:MAG: hypothetical protein CML68_13540 [Rhodobacteraceae bacterium]|nr:hypothetical protein [Paracoccaceae bacterium]
MVETYDITDEYLDKYGDDADVAICFMAEEIKRLRDANAALLETLRLTGFPVLLEHFGAVGDGQSDDAPAWHASNEHREGEA